MTDGMLNQGAAVAMQQCLGLIMMIILLMVFPDRLNDSTAGGGFQPRCRNRSRGGGRKASPATVARDGCRLWLTDDNKGSSAMVNGSKPVLFSSIVFCYWNVEMYF
jgi:hypothetical protein